MRGISDSGTLQESQVCARPPEQWGSYRRATGGSPVPRALRGQQGQGSRAQRHFQATQTQPEWECDIDLVQISKNWTKNCETCAKIVIRVPCTANGGRCELINAAIHFPPLFFANKGH